MDGYGYNYIEVLKDMSGVALPLRLSLTIIPSPFHSMQAARILVDGQSDLVLDYGIPPEAGDVRPGCRVQVPPAQQDGHRHCSYAVRAGPCLEGQAQAHSETDRPGTLDFPGHDESGLLGGGLLFRSRWTK